MGGERRASPEPRYLRLGLHVAGGASGASQDASQDSAYYANSRPPGRRVLPSSFVQELGFLGLLAFCLLTFFGLSPSVLAVSGVCAAWAPELPSSAPASPARRAPQAALQHHPPHCAPRTEPHSTG